MHVYGTYRDDLTALAARLNSAPHGDKNALVKEVSTLFGRSPQQVYADLRTIGWASNRKRRRDQGSTNVSEAEARHVAMLIRESRRDNDKQLLSIETAIEIGRANGQIDSEASVATFSRAMRQYGMHPDQLRQPAPHTTLRSLHPNHVWQFDVSLCVLFYMDGDGTHEMPNDRFYKNKPENGERVKPKRVLRYLVTDHCSGAFYLKYYLANGENQTTLFEFLMEAFGRKADITKEPFHGVPHWLIWDAGSANQSHAIKNLLNRLDVKHQAHLPGNPRAKGQVESTHNLIERDFEGRLYLVDVQDIDHLNELARTWMRYYNGTEKHARHGHTRYGIWQTIRPEQLRIAPSREVCQSLLDGKPEQRTVQGNLVIRYQVKGFESMEYSVRHVPHIRVGDKVQVCVNPYNVPAVYVIERDADGQEVRFECQPIAKDDYGFALDAPVIGQDYRAAPDTDTDRLRKQMAKEVYGAETEREAKEARRKRQAAFGGNVDPITYLDAETPACYMERRGIELPITVPREEVKPLSSIQAARRLAHILDRPLTAAENNLIRNLYPEGVPEEALDDLHNRLRGTEAGAVAGTNRR